VIPRGKKRIKIEHQKMERITTRRHRNEIREGRGGLKSALCKVRLRKEEEFVQRELIVVREHEFSAIVDDFDQLSRPF
jgi:hypothetical protein